MLRRMLGPIVIGVGVFLVLLGVLMPGAIYHRLAVLPLDPQVKQVAHGEHFNAILPRNVNAGGTQELKDQGVTVSVYVTEDRSQGSLPSNSPNAHWRIAQSVTIDNHGLLQTTVEGVSLDRHTAEANNCCGDYILTEAGDTKGTPVHHQGYLFQFPFTTQKQSYPIWDSLVRKTFPANFVDEEKHNGFTTYKFEQTVPVSKYGTQALPGALFGLPTIDSALADSMYTTHRTYWVEPNSGAIVDYTESMNRYYQFQGRTIPTIVGTLSVGPLPHDSNAYKLLRTAAVGLPFLKKTGPLIFIPLGIILVIAGLVLTARRARDDREDADLDDELYDDDDEDEYDEDSSRRSSV